MAIPNKALTPGIGIITAVAAMVVGAVYWWPQRPVAQGASLTPPISTTHLPGLSWNKPADHKNESSARAKPAPAAPAATSIRQRMRTTTDWYALAKEILPQAQAGNPEAQYVLYQAIAGCKAGANAEGGKFESLEAARNHAIQLFPNAPQVSSMYESGYKRCHGFYAAAAAGLGDPWDWLQKATDAGYAPAQAATAAQRLTQGMLKASASAGDAAVGTATLPPIGGDADPRELLVTAVQSADPEVLVQIGSMQGLLNPGTPREVTQLMRTAWMYAACQRGFDCSEYTLGMAPGLVARSGPDIVPSCGPYESNCVSVPRILMERVNYNWAPVQEIVNQINAALAAQQWDKLPGLTLGAND